MKIGSEERSLDMITAERCRMMQSVRGSKIGLIYGQVRHRSQMENESQQSAAPVGNGRREIWDLAV